jgi:hypothetical protein
MTGGQDRDVTGTKSGFDSEPTSWVGMCRNGISIHNVVVTVTVKNVFSTHRRQDCIPVRSTLTSNTENATRKPAETAQVDLENVPCLFFVYLFVCVA